MSETSQTAAEKAPQIRIINSAHVGFRRGGIAHPRDETYPADAFTAEQIDLIEAEPMLTLIYENGAEKPKAGKARK